MAQQDLLISSSPQNMPIVPKSRIARIRKGRRQLGCKKVGNFIHKVWDNRDMPILTLQ